MAKVLLNNAAVVKEYPLQEIVEFFAIASHANGLTTRVVDVRGNIASETIRKSGSQYNTTTYEYNEPFSRVSKILTPGGAQPTVITYPNWRANRGTANIPDKPDT